MMYKFRFKIALKSHKKFVILSKDYEFNFVPRRGMKFSDTERVFSIGDVLYDYDRKAFIGGDAVHAKCSELLAAYEELKNIGFIDVSCEEDGEVISMTEGDIDKMMVAEMVTAKGEDKDIKSIVRGLIADFEGYKHRKCYAVHLTKEDEKPFLEYVLSNEHLFRNDEFYDMVLKLGSIEMAIAKTGKNPMFLGRILIFGSPERKAVGNDGISEDHG
jgi:hypothetical protein